MIGVHSHRLVLESRFERIVHARAQALLASQHRAGCGAESGDCDDSLVTPTGTDPEQSFAASLSALPAAAYTTDAAGRITVYNEAAAELWGRRPELGKDRWCGSWKLYSQDGQPLPHEMCPMAAALKESRAIRGEGAVAERPDGTRVNFIAHPTPLYDAAGALIGAVNMLLDTGDDDPAPATDNDRRSRKKHLRSKVVNSA